MITDKDFLQERIHTVRRIVRGSWIPAEDEVERSHELPARIVSEMREQGLFRFLIPPAFGGDGMSCEELALINIEMSQCSVAFRTRIANNIGVAANAILHGGSEQQKAEHLPGIASGATLAAVGVSEPDFGSEATAMTTSARPHGQGWVLNGEKAFITNGPIADLYVVFARTGEPGSRAGGISAFLVKPDDAGFRRGPAYRSMGQHGAPYSSLYFKDCVLPADRLLGLETGKGFKAAWHAFRFQRIQLAALCIGPAIRLVEEALKWTASRRQFGKAISEHQLIQGKLADCQTEIAAARALVLETARNYDEGRDVTMEASICKYFSTEMACRVADRVVQMFGARGYFADFSCVERLYRDLRSSRFAEGTSEIHQITIAREMFKRAGLDSGAAE
ncbi:MAG: acyl-CoA dehydrogenase family protein [Burkholderiaceae bacterium]|nr:acyl-CoA dehydrogenase family protein [Burkholderiaceae bacterium]